MIPGWEYSQGAKAEFDYAKANNIPVYIWPYLPSAHLIETCPPAEARTELNKVMGAYRQFLHEVQF